MTVVLQHHCDGTAGTASSAAGEGFTKLTGTAPDYVAGGYIGTALTFPGAATAYYQDNLTNQYLGFYVRRTGNPATGANFAMAATSGGTSCAALTITTAGKIAAWSSLSTNIATSTSTITDGNWHRIEWNVTATTQEVRIFLDPTATTPTETLTGASNGTLAQWRYGIAWAANNAGPFDLDEITVCDAWPNMGVTTPPPSGPVVRGVISGGVEVAATIRGVIQAGVEVAATVMQVIGDTAPAGSGDTLPAPLPFTLN